VKKNKTERVCLPGPQGQMPRKKTAPIPNEEKGADPPRSRSPFRHKEKKKTYQPRWKRRRDKSGNSKKDKIINGRSSGEP